MNKRITRYIVLLFATALFTGCGDFLEESSQDNDYVRTWKDLNELLLGGCYMEVGQSSNYAFLLEANKGSFLHVLADETEENNDGGAGYQTHFDDHERIFAYHTWQQRTGTKQDYTDFYVENTTWTKVYKNINVANNILNSVDKVPQVMDAEIEGAHRVKGEALFLRGYYYFWLVNIYGKPYNPQTSSTDLGVPLKTSEQVLDVKYVRNSVQEVYDLVLTDLLAAEEELSQVTKPQKSIYRADINAVRLLLSRVYLYMQNWEKAAEYARKVIAAHPQLMDLNTDKNYFMTKDNPENIFSMGGDDMCQTFDPALQGHRVSHDLYQSHSANDLRREYWYYTYDQFVGLTKRRGNFEMYPGAYKKTDIAYYHMYYTSALGGSQSEVSSLFWMRSAEAYLNLAEAEAYLGHDDEARSALKTLRAARFYPSSPEINTTASGSELVSQIRLERRHELALEGHRWFDLRRYRVCSVQPEKISITHNYSIYRDRGSRDILETRQFVLTEDDESWTLPIPHEVLEFNTGMPNNGNLWRDYVVVETVK